LITSEEGKDGAFGRRLAAAAADDNPT